MHRRTGTCYKHCITAENSFARDSSNIKEGFRLWIRLWKQGWGNLIKKANCQIGKGRRGREIVPKTEQVRKRKI